jgi:hypothetical protein
MDSEGLKEYEHFFNEQFSKPLDRRMSGDCDLFSLGSTETLSVARCRILG